MLDAWSLGHSRLKKRLYLLLRLRRDLERAATIHFTSRAEHDSTRSRLHLTAPVVVRPLGIDLREFGSLPPHGRLRERYPQVGRRPVVLYLGRLHAGKGLELLVPALAQCGVESVMLLVVGPDQAGYRSKVEALMRHHDVSDRVIFTGMVRGAERLEALVDADLLALPSFHENFGLVVVEALACGTPVIISDEVNIHQEIADAGVGAVVPTRVGPLAEALRTWLTDHALRRAAAGRAQEFTRRTYDLERIARQWIDHYRAIVEAHRGADAVPAVKV
jgi:glycosyltransferase involved in cell wall biosynthesis